MDDVLKMAAADAASTEKVPEDKLKRIEYLGRKKVELTKMLEDLEAQVDSVKEALRKVTEHDLPEAMDDVGMASFTLDDGTEFEVKPFYAASIPEERKPEAFEYLKEHNFEGLIKGEVTIKFGKGEFEIAQEFLRFIRGFNLKPIDPEYKESVHWQTLRAWVKEQIEGGLPIPLDMFGVYIGRKAEIKAPKKSKR